MGGLGEGAGLGAGADHRVLIIARRLKAGWACVCGEGQEGGGESGEEAVGKGPEQGARGRRPARGGGGRERRRVEQEWASARRVQSATERKYRLGAWEGDGPGGGRVEGGGG